MYDKKFLQNDKKFSQNFDKIIKLIVYFYLK